MLNTIWPLLVAGLICYFVSLPVIWALKVFRVGQIIRPEGPKMHYSKSGTPTMAGISMIFTVAVFLLVMINVDINLEYLALFILFIGYSFLGFLDDHLKLSKRQNEGLTASQKMLGQIFFASVFAGILVHLGYAAKMGDIFALLGLNNPFFFFPFTVLVVISASNAVNLTDGLDGLAPGTLAIAFAALGFVATQLRFTNESMIAFAAAGAALAFLRFNWHPAEVFMGDVASLPLGALFGALAVMIHKELILLAIGAVFVIETLSVMIQVSSYKIFGRRVFKMSPLHHHFELIGVPEVRIVLIFYVIGIISAGLGIFFYRSF